MMLKIIDAKEVFTNIKPNESNDFLQYFIQEDVYDFHVFRVLQGTYEGSPDGYTVEMENISKRDVVEEMKIELGGLDIREAFKYIDELDTVKAVIRMDVDKGYENMEFKVVESLEEVHSLITNNDFYQVEHMLYEDTEVDKADDSNSLRLHGSLVEAKDLLNKLLLDERSNQYENILVQSYQNGREQGYALVYTDKESGEKKAISFAEQRNSDSIIVYHGLLSETSISDDAYRNAESFKYRHFNAASNYIFGLLELHTVKSNGKTPFIHHEGLQTAESVIQLLLNDARKENQFAVIEGLQMGDLNGYCVYLYGTSGSSKMVGISSSSGDDIALHMSGIRFQGIDPNCEVELFEKEDIQSVIERIYSLMEDKKTA